MAVIVELVTYPIKGCAGVRLPEAELTDAGLRHDRSFMVTDTEGVFRSQRRDPRLALIRPALDAGATGEGLRMTLAAEGAGSLGFAVDTEGPRRAVTLFKNSFLGIDQGEAAAEWLSGVLGKPSRLVRVPPEHDRVTDGIIPGTSGYADSSALHVLSRSSLDLLHERLAKREAPPLPMDRFRPNVVVDGWETPHTEDRARRVRAGTTLWGWTKPAVRCAVTTVDQSAGVREGPEPLRTLADYRRGEGGGVVFGAKFSVLRGGRLAVGDELLVDEWAPPEPD
ncbi:MOSC domain-containing protein [Streptomyces physcomitrii]|uniref:MOSC domain-containing protein n=1 Tax=Streptomyces physcomitrii TaxID=2724184 RepID=UPI0028ACFCEF|nr:MOSC N-terminal beta barrel domain-containing protein [Streptomyces physcomitrii]